jgi:hypothetical protein
MCMCMHNSWGWKQDVFEILDFDSTVIQPLSQEDFIIVLVAASSLLMLIFLLLQKQYKKKQVTIVIK